jgi:predicted phosphodiesterase
MFLTHPILPFPASENPRARYAVIGDIHANLEALTAVLEDAHRQGCTRCACVGDVVGYNANPTECVEIVRRLGMVCVKGNHDEYSSSDAVIDNLNARAAATLAWTRLQLSQSDKQWLRELKYVRTLAGFSIVHATLDGPEGWGYVWEKMGAAASFSYQRTTVCFYGHTHLPLTFIWDGCVRGGTYSKFALESGRKYLVNVGSVGEPRDGDPRAAYAIYDLGEHSIELCRVPYDVEKAEAKVRAAGLPGRRFK